MVNREVRRNNGVRMLVRSALGAAIISVCSWIAIPITPPITLQLFAIFLCSGLFGSRAGLSACLVWASLGALGLPVFSGGGGGLGILLGHSGGYIFGFIVASLTVGVVADHTKRRLPLALAMIGGTAAAYLFGSLWYVFVFMQNEIAFWQALSVCVLPFLPWDAVKIVLAVFVIGRLEKFFKTY